MCIKIRLYFHKKEKQISKLKSKTSILYLFHSNLWLIAIHGEAIVSLSLQQQPCSSPDTRVLFILKISTPIPQSHIISWLLCLIEFTQSVCTEESCQPEKSVDLYPHSQNLIQHFPKQSKTVKAGDGREGPYNDNN